MPTLSTQTLGYPRIGREREMKRALEAYWKGEMDADALWATFWEVAEAGWRDQLAAGIDHIGVGSASLYDPALDWAARLGLIPPRFRALAGLERYFAMARGADDIPALELTKWFDTNYHYLVPEVDAGDLLPADFSDFLALVERAQAILGTRAVPIVLGPVTLLRLARLEGDFDAALAALLPRYAALLDALQALGVAEVQLHEPALVQGDAALRAPLEKALAALAEVGVPLNLVTFFDDVGDAYPWLVRLPAEVITLDFTRGDTLGLVQRYGFPADKVLAAGVVDGRSVWRVQPAQVVPLVEALRALAPNLRASASASLQFVPYSAARETELSEALRGVLAFAEEKLAELATLAQGDMGAASAAWGRFRAFAPADPAVQGRVAALEPADFARAASYAERRPQQIALPLLPTTTIGSFPQTAEVRRMRARFRRGELTRAEYHAEVDAFIRHAIEIQEEIGLDVLVHGEFERSDMVEYFAQQLQGFAFTRYGWVQSFGSRYVRPPIIYADVARPAPMTTRAFEVAQALTEKPVKGMLTGPVTILNWSYPRVDIPRREIAYQIALALRDEIADLERAGARIIQVDEPALREGLPLQPARREAYLTWAVDAFRLATARARAATQIHTHMCYAEFGAILPAIDRLDADVISIENARSGDETLRELADYGYSREVGPGVYDIHSPVVPAPEFIHEKLAAFLTYLDPERVWVNPDCGLKTRAWHEVVPALESLVAAARELREKI